MFLHRKTTHIFPQTSIMECNACELNNIGVRLLVQGSLKEANDSFSKAAQMVQRCIHGGNNKDGASRSGVTVPENFKTVAIPAFNEAVNGGNVSEPSCSNSFVYRRAVLLPQVDVGPPNIEIISVIILFNMVRQWLSDLCRPFFWKIISYTTMGSC
jgi:hypothetical protein